MSTTVQDLPQRAEAIRTAALVSYRRVVMVVVQLLLLAIAYLLSFVLRFDFDPPREMVALAFRSLPLVVLVQVLIFYVFGLLAGWWRYVGTSDIWEIAKASLVSQAVLLPIIASRFHDSGYPRSVLASDFALAILITGGARVAVRTYTDSAQRHPAQRRTLVVGAGQAGSSLVRELKRNPALDLKPVGFVDDDRSKKDLRIHGVRVLGPCEWLPHLIARHNVACVVLAIPSAGGAQVEQTIRRCRECKVEFLILPSVRERIRGQAMAQHLRSVRMEDLLGREPVQLDLAGIRAKVAGKTLLITGAGGSIGSELARQIARFGPKRLLLFERAENDLFRLCMELEAQSPDLPYVPVIGDILDVGCLREVFAQYRPESIFHAAAYKHVPMMERHCFQAVTNNVLGTYNVALVARQYGAGDFVLISSDKAVCPTNIMGVTKRVAELIVLGLQKHSTRYIAVRFGNVLGSNGSVLPTFQQQIAAGGPVTVTHPDASRYFMTIPEAVQLVLQASAMGCGGEIFILDMGQPVRILELARNLIRLTTAPNSREIDIVFTGLRPGEKLHEELMIEGEGVKPTSNNKIRVLAGGQVEFAQVHAWVDELAELVAAKNIGGLVRKLKQIVPEYTPSPEIASQSEVDCHDLALQYKQARASLAMPDAA